MLFIITTHEGITAHVLWLLVVVVIVFVWFRGLCQSYHNPRDHVFNNGQYHVYRCISHHMSSSSQFNCSTASAILYSIPYSITKHMFHVSHNSTIIRRQKEWIVVCVHHTISPRPPAGFAKVYQIHHATQPPGTYFRMILRPPSCIYSWAGLDYAGHLLDLL